MSDAHMNPNVLHGWKSVAAYLSVSVRSVQNWERERGLPVYRTRGARGRIVAYPQELDAWIQRRALPVPPPCIPPQPERRSFWSGIAVRLTAWLAAAGYS